MKPFRLLVAIGLALTALVSVVLALAWWKPAAVRAEDASGPLPRSVIARRLLEWQNGWYLKDAYLDYAPSGVPDFDQRQDEWGIGSAPGELDWQWTHCGPVAAADSLWWFDSKFEPQPVGPSGGPPPMIPYNDDYSLVSTYATADPRWDDHAPQNVAPFVDDLAWYMDTDGTRTGRPIGLPWCERSPR